MSRRARRARRLANLLTSESGTAVSTYYDRDIDRYRVAWTNGPDVAQMYTLAIRHASDIPQLDLTTLQWDRATTKPTQ
jgi:hypothetical protein